MVGKSRVRDGLFWALVAVILAVSLGPVWYLVVSSFANDQEQFDVGLWPGHWDLTNYRIVLDQPLFLSSLLNSVLVATVAVSLALGLAVMAAYALGRISFRGRGLLLRTILAASMFPQVAVLAGMFEMVRYLGLYNSIWSLAVAQGAFTLPFCVWLMTTFLRDLPVEIEEAAIIDGATPWIVVTRIFLPLLAPAMVTAGLLAFIGSWNEFLFALTLTISEDQRTVPVAMTMLNPYAWGQAAAASVIVTAPLVGLVMVFQRRIVAGLTAGSLAG